MYVPSQRLTQNEPTAGCATFLVNRFRLAIGTIYIGNRMKAGAFHNIWVRVMFLKFSKLHEPQASAI